MTRIFKYPLNADGTVTLLPPRSKPLSVALQNEAPHVWAEVVDDQWGSATCVHALPTGAEVPNGLDFIGTVHMLSGRLVVHYYWGLR